MNLDERARQEQLATLDRLEAECAFDAAAELASALLLFDRAVILAAIAGRRDRFDASVERVDPARFTALADELDRRGYAGLAGIVFAKAGDDERAAEAFERAGEGVASAAHFDKAKRPKDAARVLEATLAVDPHHREALLALGRLLVRHQRFERAASVLQKLPPPRRDALALLEQCYGALGLEELRASIAAEMQVESIEAEPRRAPETPTFGGGRFTPIRKIWEGARATVFEGRDDRGGPVALKQLTVIRDAMGRDALLRFEREAKILRALESPHVVRLIDYLPEVPLLVFEWMTGGDLARLVETEPLSPARAKEVIRAVLLALDVAHGRGVLHRDIKPSNVLFDAAGNARLSDFGAGHFADLGLTITRAVIGTEGFMSPEQRRGEPASIASDLYGVGALFYFLLLGSPPDDALSSGLSSARERGLGPDHERLLASWLASDPSARPSSAREALVEVESLAWSDELPERTHDPGGPSSAEPPASGRLTFTASVSETPRIWLATDREANDPVWVVEVTPETLSMAKAFSSGDRDRFATIYRVDERSIWVEPPAFAKLDRPLEDEERSAIEKALGALHAQGITHGSISRESFFQRNGSNAWVLSFPTLWRSIPSDHAEDVRAELAALQGLSRV